MTKVRTLSADSADTKLLKKIEFVKCISAKSDEWYPPLRPPREWDYIDLICKNWACSGLDLMRYYDSKEDSGGIAIGHFNDGVV